MKLTWLLLLYILFFNFLPAPNKYLGSQDSEENYVNRPSVCLMCVVQNGHVPFLQLFVPNDSAFV